MAEPSKKSPEMESALNHLLGCNRVDSIRNNKCTICGGPANEFKDKLSAKEYAISGMCQKCQDKTFGP